jgi:hypothetical protein
MLNLPAPDFKALQLNNQTSHLNSETCPMIAEPDSISHVFLKKLRLRWSVDRVLGFNPDLVLQARIWPPGYGPPFRLAKDAQGPGWPVPPRIWPTSGPKSRLGHMLGPL